ncbi:DNA dC-_dU-editing enzyme APOBEC-3C-like isoform 1-T3 [Anomaloglossus baeobatrachus]|uniref:DNA dC->dU-editing enzyme APOBEC-3C-like n=1 Tax=Anomaloglossus baeobatrachus TaxID=238106 RepID=UPI003F50443C
MTLFIRRFLSEEEFNDNFNTVDLMNKTLVCFSLEDKKPPWKLWGFAYNNPGVEHAEITVLRELSKFWSAISTKKESQFKITFYATYSPCLNCCEEICKFLDNWKQKVIMNMNISKFYHFHDIDNKISLKILRKYGVQIKMMDLEDFKALFYLFVDPKEQFEPCKELNIQCERNNIELDHLWSEEFEEFILRRKGYNSVLFASKDMSPDYDNDAYMRLQKDNTTPKKVEQEKESQAKTPVKLPPMRDMEHKAGFKRKLSFDYSE